MVPRQGSYLLYLAFPEKAGGAKLSKPENPAANDLDADCLGKADCLVAARLYRTKGPLPDAIRHDHQRRLAAADPTFLGAIENAQPSSSGNCSPARLSGCPGCIVETACL